MAIQHGKAGRPTTFHNRLLPQVRKMAKSGMTELEIADVLDVAPKTLWEWKSKYPKLGNALELGKRQSNERVKRALYHRAVGYTHDAVKIFNDKGEPIYAPYREHVPPDTNAAIFWLKNRLPDEWQDRTQTELSGSVSVIAATLNTARTRLLSAKSSAPILEATLDPEDTSESDATD